MNNPNGLFGTGYNNTYLQKTEEATAYQNLAQKMQEHAELLIESGTTKVEAFQALLDKYYEKTKWHIFDRACILLTEMWEYGHEFLNYRKQNL